LRTISIISSEIIAWILFTFPAVEDFITVFTENLIIEEKHVLDSLGDILIELDEYIENPAKMKEKDIYLLKAVNDISMGFYYLSKMVEKGAIEN
jgi:hypothetical protein